MRGSNKAFILARSRLSDQHSGEISRASSSSMRQSVPGLLKRKNQRSDNARCFFFVCGC